MEYDRIEKIHSNESELIMFDEFHENIFIDVCFIFRRVSSTHGINSYQDILLWPVLFVCLLVLAGPLALRYSYRLPSVKSRLTPLHEFSEERARDYYPNLTQYGPRVSDTYADHMTRAFLISQIARLRSMRKTSVQFELDLQNFTGANTEQMQNIAIRLSNINSSSTNMPCLLLVAHYDTGK
jgi:hypothetical protein